MYKSFMRISFFLFFFLFFSGAIFAQSSITISNYTNGTEIDYPVALIYGAVSDPEAKDVLCRNLSSDRTSKEIHGSAWQGRFKVLAELVPGENKLELVSGDCVETLTLSYRKNDNPLVVRVIYMTDSSGATEYQTQKANDPQNYKGKLDTLMKLMQTFTAERMNDLGFGRKTFNIELDDKGDVVVHLFKGQKTAQEYYEMSQNKWYEALFEELRVTFPLDNARNLVIPAYTRFDSETKQTKGHTALGGGAGQALFGSGNMFTWPDALTDVVAAMTDSTPIDTDHFMDDSVGRSNFWGAASTTMGACLHELGHTFDLPHSEHPHDIMTRGIDRFNRAFVMREAPHRHNPNWYDFKEDEIALWPPVSAYPLMVNRFLADSLPKPADNHIDIQFNNQTGEISISSPDRIWFVNCFCESSVRWFFAPPLSEELPTSCKIPFLEIQKICPPEAKIYDFQVRDKNGAFKMLRLELNRNPK